MSIIRLMTDNEYDCGLSKDHDFSEYPEMRDFPQISESAANELRTSQAIPEDWETVKVGALHGLVNRDKKEAILIIHPLWDVEDIEFDSRLDIALLTEDLDGYNVRFADTFNSLRRPTWTMSNLISIGEGR